MTTTPSKSSSTRRRSRRGGWLGKALASASVLALPMASAQTLWMPNTAGNYSWQTAENWQPNAVPTGAGTVAEMLNFSSGTQNVSLNGAVTLGRLNFSNNIGSSYFLLPGTGGTLAFNSGGASNAAIVQTGTGRNVISSPISLAENLKIQVDAGHLNLTGVISGTGFGLVKEGNGMLVLTGTNTFTGASELKGGITFLGSSAALGGTAGGTTVASGATLGIGSVNGLGNSTSSEPWTLNGSGYLGMGAVRGMYGANTNTLNGNVTFGSDTLIHNDITGTLQFNGNMTFDKNVRFSTHGFIILNGVLTGNVDIVKYGLSGLRFSNTTNANTYSGSITSILGEIRAENVNAYQNVARFTMRNSNLQLVFASTVNSTEGRLADTTPIDLYGGRIRLENSAFSGNPAFNFAETVGAVTLKAGGNMIDMRGNATGNSVALTLSSLTREAIGSTLYMEVNGTASGAAQLGTSTQSRILNSGTVTHYNGTIGGWATTRLINGSGEFVKYDPTNGYTALVAANYSVDTDQTTWTGGTLNVKLTNLPTTSSPLTANRSVNTLNIYSDTARTLELAGRTLSVENGGIMFSRNSSGGPTHAINGGFITAGPGPSNFYELFLHTANANGNISAVITDNGLNPVSVVKAGPNTVSYLASQTYTGSTYLNEGVLRDFIGYRFTDPTFSAIPSTNINVVGSVVGQSVLEFDRDFTRTLGTGANQIQFTGGTGAGFSAYGRPIDINFGGAGDTIVWGGASSHFNPGIFTVNGGNATHVATLVNPIDLNGEVRYFRVDGNSSGGGRAAIARIEGDLFNGGIVKRGGGTLIIDSAKTYSMGTSVSEGLLWVRGAGNFGQNVIGNDINIGATGALHIDSPSNVGSLQRIVLQNTDNGNAAAIGFGPGYGDGSGISFNMLTAANGLPATGGNEILITNSQTAASNAPTRRVAIQMNGMSATSVDFPGLIRNVAPYVEVWFGASTANGVYSGTTLTATGNTAADSSRAFRLGSGGGTLTIEKANVLSGVFPLIVGSNDQNGRTNIGGVVYLPQAQNYSGQVTVGSGGTLVVGQNGALSTANNTINLRGGELRLSLKPGTYYGTDDQYAARNIDISAANATMRVESLGGSGMGLVSMNTLRLDGSERVLTVTSSTTRQNGILFLGKTTLNHTAASNAYFDIGFDNQGYNSGFLYLMGVVEETGTGPRTLIKRQGGTLVLSAANTFAGGVQLQQGNLVLTNTAAAGTNATLTMAINGDRTARLNFLKDGAGPHLYNYTLSFTGGNNGSNRIITVAPETVSSTNVNQEIQVPSISWAAVASVTNFDLITDGAHGYRLTVNGNVTLGRDINFRTRGALTTIQGQITGAFNVLKAEQGTLWLNGNNTYTGTTTVNNGYLVLGHDNALGATPASAVTFGSTGTSQILLNGTRSVTRNITNSATGGVQTLGGLDTGAKTFGGNVVLTRGINVSAMTGGDVNFTGVISAAGGINKVGTGIVVLNPTVGTGNSYAGGTTVTAGTLIGQAQASGNPFGSGAFTVANGTIQLNGRAGANGSAISAAGLTVSGGARVVVNDLANDAFSTTFGFSTLARSGAGTVTFVPQLGNLGTQELITFGTNPTLVNGIVGTWAVRTASGSNSNADYVTTSGSGPFGLTTASYAVTGSLDTAGVTSTQTLNAGSTASTLTTDRSVYAFRTDANVDLAGFKLNVGNGGQAGIILNNGASINGVSGSALNFGTNQLNMYVSDTAVSSISVPLVNVRDNVNNTFSTNAEPAVNNAPVFVKFGRGTLVLNTAATFQGGINVNEGTLRAGAANVFPTFSNLNAVSGSIVTISPGATVDLNNFDQEFGNLSGGRAGAEFQFAGGVLNLGSAKLTVGREAPGTTATQTFSGQVVGGAGSRIVKVGSGRLVLDNISGNTPNSLDVLEITQGIVRTWLNDQSWATPTSVASAIPKTTTVLLRGGEWEAYAIGDSTTNQQIIQIGNNVIHQGADSIIDASRPTGAGGNKLLTFGTLSLDVQRLVSTGANTYIPRFDGLTTLTNHARIQNDSQLVLAGGISDGGNGYTINKIGASDLTIDRDNSATWSGGLVITQGTLYFGTRGADEIRAPGVTLTLNPQANAGTGDIVLNQGFTTTTALRMAAPSNVLTAQGQRVQTFGSETSGTVRIDIGTDAPLANYGLRSTSNGSISLGLGDGGLYTNALDQAAMGSGRWGISAFQGNNFYMPTTLGAGFDNTYRFMGTNAGVLNLVSTNVLTGVNSVVLGRDPLAVGNVPTNAISQIRTYGNQNFTGNTVIHRGADYGSIGNILIFHGDYATPVFDVYGRLEARGDGRFTNDAGAQVNQVILRPGGALRLDYNMDVNDQFVIARLENSNLGLTTHENKWGDTTPMILDGAQLGLVSGNGRVNSETVGEITVKGGAGIFLERSGAGQPILVTNEGIVRDGQALLALRNTTVAELGSSAIQSQKFFINDPTWVTENMNNGMFNPWFFNATNLGYLGYSADTGVVNVPYVTGTGAGFFTGLTSTSIAHYSTAGNAILSATANIYALRVTGTTTLSSQQINLHSGGLITNGAVTIDSALYFGNGNTNVPVEGVIYAADNTLTINGKVTATTLTRGGPSTVVLGNTANSITGNIQINGGTLIANGAGTLGTAPTITLHADYHNNNNGSQMPILSLRTASIDQTFSHEVVIAQNVPLARIELNRFGTTAVDVAKTITIPTLTVKGTSGAGGTLLQIESVQPNDNRFYNLTVNGLTKLEGTSNIGIRVNAGTTTFNGVVSGAADLIKTGDGVLRFNDTNNTFSGDFILNRGEWYTVNNAASVGGTGNVISNFGTIRMANTSGTTGTRFSAPNQTVTINGQTTLVTQRTGSSTNANISIGAVNNGNVFTTNNSPWMIFQAASFGDQINFNSSVVINDAPWFRTDSAFTLFRTGSVVSGEGKLNKAGTYYLAFDNNAPNTYAGGTDIWTGELQVRQPSATLGSGAVRLYAGASLAVRGVSSLGDTGVTQIVTSDSAFPVIGVRGADTAGTFTDAFNAVINNVANTATIVGNGNGVLAVSGGQTLTVDPAFATRNGGIFANWWLGSQGDSGAVNANSILPWGPMGNEFRMGGGHNGSITLNPTTPGSDQLSGGGVRLIVGAGQNIMGYGAVVIGSNADNTFDGGTLVTRTRDLSGAFRGAALVLQGGQIAASGPTAYRAMLGIGDVDVFGEIRVEGANSTLRISDTENLNNYIFHPGSRIRFDNGSPFAYATSQGRWADNVGMTLNTTVLEMFGDDTNHVHNSETIGDLEIGGGSEIVLRRRGSQWAELKVGNITRDGNGTLMLTTMVDNTNTVNILGGAGEASTLRLIASNGASLVDSTTGMVQPWITSRVDNQFLKYDSTLGFQLVTQGTPLASYKAITTTTLTPGTVVPANNGTEILSLEGGSNFTLGGNLDIHALRVQRDININAASGFDSITIRSGGLIQAGNTPTINANLYFGVGGNADAFVSASNNTLQLNGKIYAKNFIKSGSAFVSIRSDQPQFTGDWVVNGGGIQFLTPGAASTGEVLLNGSRMNDRDNTFNLTEVRYNFNPGTPDVFTWNGGKITATDYNRIYGIAASDRTIQIPAIDLKTTNATAGTGQEGAVILRMDGLRSIMRTGTVTLHDHYMLYVESDRGGPGATTGVQLGSGTGVNGIYNQGLYDVRKTGPGMLILGDNSGSFINGRTFTVGDGGVRVMHNGAFGNSSISAIINPTGALEIAVPNWTPTANLTQAWGSTERWAVNQARGSGDYTLPTGVHLQIMASQTGSRTIDLDGGSIMGYLPLDWEQVAVNHTLTSGITINLLSNSYLGQLYPAGTSNGANHFLYDMGKMNTTTNLNPNDPGLRGSYLHVNGNITGNFDLTKVGQDMIILSGAANSFRNTNIENGILQIGRDNTLPTTTELTTRFSGMFDLNGYNQEVAALKGSGGSINNGAFDYNNLTVNQASDTTYGGQINGTTNLVKSGVGNLTLSAPNSAYIGDTKINAGSLILTGSAAINESRWIQVGAGAGFNVSGRTGGSYSFDGIVSGGGVGALRADNANRGLITGSLVVTDSIGLAARKGTLAPGGSSLGSHTTAGDQIGHLAITQDLTLAGGTSGNSVERLTLQLGGSTTTLADLGWDGSSDLTVFISGLASGTTNQQGALNGTYGNLSGHDYVNVGGELELNQYGTVRVSYANNYTPQSGDVFNLLDWTTISGTGFSVGSVQRVGGGFESSDLYLPTLTSGLAWNTSLFMSHGVLVVVPEPSRALLLLGAMMALGFRRRRSK